MDKIKVEVKPKQKVKPVIIKKTKHSGYDYAEGLANGDFDSCSGCGYSDFRCRCGGWY